RIPKAMRADRNTEGFERLFPDSQPYTLGSHRKSVLGDPEMVLRIRSCLSPGKQGRAVSLLIAIEQESNVGGQDIVHRLRVLGLGGRNVKTPTSVLPSGEMHPQPESGEVLDPQRPRGQEGDHHPVAGLHMLQMRAEESAAQGFPDEPESKLQ